MDNAKTIKNAAFSGVIGFILLALMIIFNFLTNDTVLATGTPLFIIYIFLNILYVVALIFFAQGFKIVGKKTDNGLLITMSYVWIVMNILALIYLIFSLFIPSFSALIVLLFIIPSFIIIGIASIFFGISLLTEGKKFGSIATVAGALSIISGASFISIIFFFAGALLIIPTFIAEIIFLFKASEVLEKTSNTQQEITNIEQRMAYREW